MDLTPTQRYLPWIVATALFMEQLDSTIVNTGIPAMAASLGVTPLSLKAVVTSYILALAVSIPVAWRPTPACWWRRGCRKASRPR
jgi:MFS family permease